MARRQSACDLFPVRSNGAPAGPTMAAWRTVREDDHLLAMAGAAHRTIDRSPGCVACVRAALHERMDHGGATVPSTRVTDSGVTKPGLISNNTCGNQTRFHIIERHPPLSLSTSFGRNL